MAQKYRAAGRDGPGGYRLLNPRDSDALAKAKSLVRGYKWQKVMLLLPRIDLAYQQGDPEVLTELDARSSKPPPSGKMFWLPLQLLTFEANSDLDNIFGIKLVLPGAKVGKAHREEIPEDAQQMLAQVTTFYLGEAKRRGFMLQGLDALVVLRAHPLTRDQPGRSGRHCGPVRDHCAVSQTQ